MRNRTGESRKTPPPRRDQVEGRLTARPIDAGPSNGRVTPRPHRPCDSGHGDGDGNVTRSREPADQGRRRHAAPRDPPALRAVGRRRSLGCTARLTIGTPMPTPLAADLAGRRVNVLRMGESCRRYGLRGRKRLADARHPRGANGHNAHNGQRANGQTGKRNRSAKPVWTWERANRTLALSRASTGRCPCAGRAPGPDRLAVRRCLPECRNARIPAAPNAYGAMPGNRANVRVSGPPEIVFVGYAVVCRQAACP